MTGLRRLTLIRNILVVTMLGSVASAQGLTADIQYGPMEGYQALDVYSRGDGAKDLPVVFWIHGGGWETGDKEDVQIKPRAFVERGFVFVSANYRLWPTVEMEVIVRDAAKALGWVHRNISTYGGDAQRIFVMGHSAGAQLAALLCIDDRYLKEESASLASIKGCVPVDGDTYDLPAIIMTAELRQAVHGLPQPVKGHRVKFGNDPKKHVEFSAVTHVKKDKGIPPFLILHVAGHPDVTAQAQRLAASLQAAEVPVQVYAAQDTNHGQLNAHLGQPDDPATVELFKFTDALLAK
jgi:arylformamidase